MGLKYSAFRIACVLLVFGWAATAQAQNWATTIVNTGLNDGGQVAVGTGLPLPIQFGGNIPNTGPTFPQLLVPVAPGAVVSQPTTTGVLPASPKPMRIPPSILFAASGAGTMTTVGQFQANPALWQIATALSFAWPDTTRTLSAGGRPGSPVSVKVGPGGPGAGTVTYTAGAAQFGGPARFVLKNGPAAAGGLFPGRPVTLWGNVAGQPPGGAGVFNVAGIFNANPAGGPAGTWTSAPLVVGATTGVATATAGTPLHPSNVRLVSGVNAQGSILGVSMPCPVPVPCSLGNYNPGLNNMATSSAGFPWTTGMITIMAPAVPPETFKVTGQDNRDAFGVGSISLVSGAVSSRTLSGPNANRGWVRLTVPEPAAVLGALGAFAMLGLCHAGLARRRSSR